MNVSPAASTDAAPSPQGQRGPSRGLALAAVLLLAVVPVLTTLRAAFIYDDTTIVRDNVWLRGWPALWRVWGEPYWPTTAPDALGLYRPFHVAMLAVVWNASHGAALAFHIYAIALAALTACAVWRLLRRATTALAAFVAALWFAANPLHVETVASVANSSELLVALCTITLVELLWTGTVPTSRELSWRRALLVGLVATAALLSKESGLLALPLALITIWGWRSSGVDRPEWRTVLRLNVRGIGAASAGIVAALVARRIALGAAVSRTSIAAQGLELDTAHRVSTMLSLWLHVAGALVWPSDLAPYYGATMIPASTAAFALAGAVVALSLLVLAIRQARVGDRRPLVALAWIALTYFPGSNLLVATGQMLSDRVLFGATIGVALAVAWTLDALPLSGRRVATGLVALLIVHATVVTARYAFTWTSHRTLWTRLIEVEPAEHLGYKLLGMDARARGEPDRAVALLARARAMAPADRQIVFEYGQALYQGHRYDEAALTLGGLLRDADVRGEPAFVAMYLDAVGRAHGAQAVIDATEPLVATSAAATAALYAGVAREQLGQPIAADSAYVVGLRASPRDSALLVRRAALTGANGRR